MRLLALLLVAACGDSISVPDAAVADAADRRGLVTVRVSGTDIAGKEVVFQTADSSVVLSTRTDAAGQASAYMDGGGFVSLLDFNASTGFRELYTWGDVVPGDVLEVRHTQLLPTAETSNHKLQLTARAGATRYELYTTCLSFPTDVTQATEFALIPPFVPCRAQQHVLVLAYDENFLPVAYQFAPDEMIASGFGSPTLALEGPWRTLSSEVRVTTRSETHVDVRQQIEDSSFVRSNSEIVNGEASIAVPMPTPTNGTVQTIVENAGFAEPTDDGEFHFSRNAVAVWGPGTPSVAIDFDAQLLRKTSQMRFDPARSRMLWDEQPEGHPGDAVYAELSFTNPRGEFIVWKVLGARDPADTTMRLPVLPGLMRALDGTVGATDLALLTLDGGHARLKQFLLGQWAPSGFQFFPVDRPTGSVRYRSLR